MSVIESVGTAVPRYCVRQELARDFGRAMFAEAFPDIDRLMGVFENTLVEQRYFSSPPEWFGTEHAFSEKNQLYLESAMEIGEAAVLRCLEAAGLEPADIDHFFFVSTTGLATPSIDARLINRLKMRNSIRRTPIWGLGCAGGAAGLARAYEYTKAFPRDRALLLAVELCALTFQRNDLSKSNLVAVALFADGAAAALVSGRDVGGEGLRILGSKSTIWYDSLDVMGWEVNDRGLKVLFSRDIPSIVRKCLLPSLEAFLHEQGVPMNSIRHVVAHPGGAKVIEAYEETLGLASEQMNHPREVLRRYGNMSSPTVLFVLREFLRSEEIQRSEYGLV